MAAAFLNALITEDLDGHLWKVEQEFDYRLGSPDGLEYVRVPAGFVTDFASIPRPLWALMPPHGLYDKAAVVHDWLYGRRRICGETPTNAVSYVRYVERAEADRILLEAMTVLGVGWMTKTLIYRGVRAGGWWAWSDDRKKETA